MTITSADLKRLAALRLEPEAMSTVLSVLAETEEREERKRAKGAERQARYRERHSDVTVAGTVTLRPPLPDKERSPRPPKEINPPPLVSDANASSSEPSSDSPAKPKKKPGYSPAFEAFWAGYPKDSLMSKKEAGEVWSRLGTEAQEAATASLPAFRSYCANHPDYRPLHACRYLKYERFTGFNELAEKQAIRVFVAKGTPQWDAWQKIKKTPYSLSLEHRRDGWWFDSEWPPMEGSHDETRRTATV